MVRDLLFGLFLLPTPQASIDCLIIFQDLLPSLSDPVTHYVKTHVWFQHDGTSPYNGRRIREH